MSLLNKRNQGPTRESSTTLNRDATYILTSVPRCTQATLHFGYRTSIIITPAKYARPCPFSARYDAQRKNYATSAWLEGLSRFNVTGRTNIKRDINGWSCSIWYGSGMRIKNVRRPPESFRPPQKYSVGAFYFTRRTCRISGGKWSTLQRLRLAGLDISRVFAAVPRCIFFVPLSSSRCPPFVFLASPLPLFRFPFFPRS